MRKKAECVLNNIPETKNSGIYALVDENGKMYIGSAINLKKRLIQHNRGMSIALSGEHDAFESQSLQNAVTAGRHFTVSILAVFPCGLSADFLRKIEREFIAEYSKGVPLYNSRIKGERPVQLKRE